LGNNIPAFLAIPKFNGFDRDTADVSAEARNSDATSITVSEGVRQQMMRKLAFGHFGSEPATSQ
jgi:hypothetical protein